MQTTATGHKVRPTPGLLIRGAQKRVMHARLIAGMRDKSKRNGQESIWGKNVDFLYKNRFPSLIETSDRSSSNSSGQQSNTAALAGMIVLGLVWPYIVSNGNGGGELENNRGHLRRQKPPRRWRFGIPG